MNKCEFKIDGSAGLWFVFQYSKEEGINYYLYTDGKLAEYNPRRRDLYYNTYFAAAAAITKYEEKTNFPKEMDKLSNGKGLYDKSALHDGSDGSKYLSFNLGILSIWPDGTWSWSTRP